MEVTEEWIMWKEGWLVDEEVWSSEVSVFFGVKCFKVLFDFTVDEGGGLSVGNTGWDVVFLA